MKTNLNKIRAYGPCECGWKTLLSTLGKTSPDDDPLSITTILESNGLDDALWCLRAVDGHDRDIRLFAVMCARSVQHLMTDQRSIDFIDAAERVANGEASTEELVAARAAIAAASASASASASAATSAAASVSARSASAAAIAAASAASASVAASAATSAYVSAATSASAAWAAAKSAARAADRASMEERERQKQALIDLCQKIEQEEA